MWDASLSQRHPSSLRKTMAAVFSSSSTPSSPTSASSTNAKASYMLGLLAIICIMPFLFSSLNDFNDPHTHQTITTQKSNISPIHYEPASVLTPEKKQSLRKRKSPAAANAAAAVAGGDDGAAPVKYETQAAAEQQKSEQADRKKAPAPQQQQAKKGGAGLPRNIIAVEDPSKKEIVASRHEAPVQIYMDWTLPAERFSLPNYRSLESVLTQYPNAHVRALVVAPVRATHYKYANTLSYVQFEKYQKRGYDVQLEVISERSLLEMQRADRPGFTYFTTVLFPRLEKTIYDESFFAKTENAIQDFKTNHFVRLFQLWETGGIYLDFTMLLTRPFPVGKSFWSFAEDCSVQSKAAAEKKGNASAAAVVQFDDQKWHYSGSQHPYVLQFKKQDPLVGCVLKRFDDKAAPLHQCMVKSQQGGSDCLQAAFEQCAAAAKSAPDVLPQEQAPVEWAACKYVNDASRSKKVLEASKNKKFAAVSMGREAMEGTWKASPDTEAAFEKHIHLDRWHPLQVDPKCARKCDYYTDAVARARAPFHQTKFSLNKNEADASNFICAPSIIVPGAIKAASSSLFTAIAKHPQVLHPLRGSNFKETGMYMNIPGRDHFKDRLQAFPFIEPSENFVTTDGTVYYINGEDSAEQIVADSPSAQAIISLRDPTSRAFSQYRYAFFNGTESFAEAVRVSVPVMRKCYQEHLAHINLKAMVKEGKGSELAKKIDFCTAPLMRTPTRRAIQTSLYLPQLLRWSSVLGSERLLIVTKEELGRDPKSVMDSVFKFLGLCSYEQAFVVENMRKMQIPEGYDLTENAMVDLNEAFQPWNQALYSFLDRDLEWPSYEEAFVQAKLHFHPIVLFKTATSTLKGCADCQKAQDLLTSTSKSAGLGLGEEEEDEAAVKVVELRHDDPVWREIAKLMAATGAGAGKKKVQHPQDATVPYVFVEGEYLGGLKEVEAKKKDGSLAKALKETKSNKKKQGKEEQSFVSTYYAD